LICISELISFFVLFFLSPPARSIKGIFDRYQQALGTSLWTEQYEVPPPSLPPSVSFDL
jgi:hypothetical protein